MVKLSKNPFVSLIAGVALLMCFLAFPAAAQDLEKKYAPILGEYEFDMAEFEWGIVTVKMYVEGGALWAWPDNSDSPGEMIPVEGEEFVFTIDAGDQGVYRLEFLKDESGKIKKCHAVNETLGMDVTGEKIEE